MVGVHLRAREGMAASAPAATAATAATAAAAATAATAAQGTARCRGAAQRAAAGPVAG